MSYDNLKKIKKLFNKNKYGQHEEEYIITYFKYNKCSLPLIKKEAEIKFLAKGTYAKVFKVRIGKTDIAVRISAYSDRNNDDNEIEYQIYKMLYDKFEEYNFVHIPILFDSYKCYYNNVYDEVNIYLLKLLEYEKFFRYVYRITLMEYTPLGNLNDLLKIKKEAHNEYYTKVYLQILIILYFLNTNIPGYYHNDLHLNNFLVRRNEKNTLFYNFEKFNIFIDDIDIIVLINDFDFSEYHSKYKKILNHKTNDLPFYKYNNFVDLFKATNYFLYYYGDKISKELFNLFSIIVPPKLAKNSVKINGIYIVDYHNILFDDKSKIFKNYYDKVPVIEDILFNEVFSKYLKHNI